MARAPSFCGVILAAGESSRMGRDKALLHWRGQTFLAGSIEVLDQHTDLVIVVAGKNEARIAPVAYAKGASVVVNPAPERGQFSSLQIGLREVLNRGRDAAVVALVDRPPVRPETLGRLRAAFEEAVLRHCWAVVPEYQGRHGHPIVIGREMIEGFLKAEPTANAREVEHAHQERIAYVTVDDPWVATNVDTPQEYEELLKAVPAAG